MACTMIFLRTYLCLFSMILACVNMGNCRELPQTNDELRARYEAKNNGLTQRDIGNFLTEAIRLGSREMVKTIKNPPLQIRIIGDKTNPKPSESTIQNSIKWVDDRRSEALLGIDGYLEVIGESETTQENVNRLFTKFVEMFRFDSCSPLLQQDIKPEQEVINVAIREVMRALISRPGNTDDDYEEFLKICSLILKQGINLEQKIINHVFRYAVGTYAKYERETSKELYELILQQDIKPDQETMNNALIKAVENNNVTLYSFLMNQDIKPDQETINNALIKAVENNNETLCRALMNQDIKPDAEQIKKAFNLSVEKDFIGIFNLLVNHLDPQDIQAAAKIAGPNGATKVLRKIISSHSPSVDVVSETLTAIVEKFKVNKKARKSVNGLEECCLMLRKNAKQRPNQNSVNVAKEAGCPQAGVAAPY